MSPDEWDDNQNWVFHPAAYIARERNIISEMIYDRASRRVSSINPMGDTVTTAYFKDGQVDSISDPEGMVTVYRYDALGRRKRVVQSFVDNGEDPENWLWDTNQYEESDGTAIVHAANNDENIIVMLNYDIAGRMISMREPRGNLTTYEYDKLGRRTKLSNPLTLDWDSSYAEVNGAQQTTMNYPGANTAVAYDVVRDFDRFGRLLQIDYNDSANTPKVNFGYDMSGNRLNMTENDGTSDTRITDYSYDNLNRLTQVDFDSDADLTVEETLNYEYDIRGLRTKLTMPGNLEIVYRYDEKGRLIALDDWDNQRSEFHYDRLNRHIATLRPNGMRSTYKLDGAGRLRELRHENKRRETLASFHYTVDGRGNRTQAQEVLLEPSASLATDIIQHSDPKVLYTGTWADSAGFHESTQWDARLALIFLGDEDVELVIGEGSDHSIFDIYIDGTLYESVDGYVASPSSRTVTISLRGDGFHSLELRNRHEHNLQSDGYKIRFQSLSVDTKLTRDVIDYSYDSVSRIQTACYNADAQTQLCARKYEFSYDPSGNRLSELLSGTGVTPVNRYFGYNVANQMVAEGDTLDGNGDVIADYTFQYDNNGNLISKQDTVPTVIDSYTWDRANRLTDVGNHSYVYDGLSNRVQQTVNTVVTDYLNDVQPGLTKLLAQSTGANTEHFVHGVRGIHAVDDGTDWNYYAQDGLGSVRAVVDDAGVVQSSMSFDPYGVPDATFDGFAYTGEMRDTNGLQYHRARYYDPANAIWAAQDFVELVNRYAYASNNPINRVDRNGLMDVDDAQVGAGGTGSSRINFQESSYSYRPVPNQPQGSQTENFRGLIQPVQVMNRPLPQAPMGSGVNPGTGSLNLSQFYTSNFDFGAINSSGLFGYVDPVTPNLGDTERTVSIAIARCGVNFSCVPNLNVLHQFSPTVNFSQSTTSTNQSVSPNQSPMLGSQQQANVNHEEDDDNAPCGKRYNNVSYFHRYDLSNKSKYIYYSTPSNDRRYIFAEGDVFAYVVTLTGQFILGDEVGADIMGAPLMNHPTLVDGAPVAYAGEIYFDSTGSSVVKWNRFSGHYQPNRPGRQPESNCIRRVIQNAPGWNLTMPPESDLHVIFG